MTPIESPAVQGGIGRRSLLTAAFAGLAIAAAPDAASAATRQLKKTAPTFATGASTTAITRPAYPGHIPGRVLVGQTYNGAIAQAETQAGTGFGVHRTFYQWDGLSKEIKAITDDHAKGRLPWVSFKPPTGAPEGWKAIASGAYDNELRARARAYAQFKKPIVSTFHHEPTDDSPEGQHWAAAYCRIYDVMKAETGLANVSFAPVHMEWVWNPRNYTTRYPEKFMTTGVMRRMPFLGIDVYQSKAHESYAISLGRIFTWMAQRGFQDKMIGIAETGACDSFGGGVTGADWWNTQWKWVTQNTHKVGILAYFNTDLNSRSYWPLDESPSKLKAFSDSAKHAMSARIS